MLPWREPDREPALSALRWAALVTGATGLRSGRTVRCEVASASGDACAEAAESSEAWARSPPEPPAVGAAPPQCWPVVGRSRPARSNRSPIRHQMPAGRSRPGCLHLYPRPCLHLNQRPSRSPNRSSCRQGCHLGCRPRRCPFRGAHCHLSSASERSGRVRWSEVQGPGTPSRRGGPRGPVRRRAPTTEQPRAWEQGWWVNQSAPVRGRWWAPRWPRAPRSA